MILNRLKNTRGFMSIEAIMGLAVMLMVIVLGIGFFTYMIPKQGIEQEVNLLGRVAKMNGGLTTQDVTAFKKNMEKRGYDQQDVKLTMVLKDVNGTPQSYSKGGIYVDPLNITCKTNDTACSVPDSNQLYVKRNAQLIMEVRAEMPANKKGLLGAFGFFSVKEDTVSDTYVFKERVMSERY